MVPTSGNTLQILISDIFTDGGQWIHTRDGLRAETDSGTADGCGSHRHDGNGALG